MENATKALLIASGVMIGIMILSLGLYLYSELGTYVDSSTEEIQLNKLTQFNEQFLKYDGITNATMQDIITVTNIAYENNKKYELTDINESGKPENLFVQVILDGDEIYNHLENENDNSSFLSEDVNTGNTYSCEVTTSEITGRVYQVKFTQN